MMKKGILLRDFLFLFIIVTMLLPFGRQVFAQEKPEVFVEMMKKGITNFNIGGLK